MKADNNSTGGGSDAGLLAAASGAPGANGGAGQPAANGGGAQDAATGPGFVRDAEAAGRDLDEDAGPGEIPSNGEICDGIDNDNNGLIDDADVEQDGVCDCLRIATIGAGGPWSGESVFRSWPNARAQNAVTALGDRVLSEELLKPYQVIILLDVAPTRDDAGVGILPAHHVFSDAEVAAFQAWVQAGGGVMTTSGYRADEATEVTNVNRLLAPFGMGYSTTKLEEDGYVETWMSHPLTQGVMKIYTANGVEPDGTNGQTLATDSLGRSALQVPRTGDARIVVWSDDWVTYETQWQATQDQQVERFWLNILAWLGPMGGCQIAGR